MAALSPEGIDNRLGGLGLDFGNGRHVSQFDRTAGIALIHAPLAQGTKQDGSDALLVSFKTR